MARLGGWRGLIGVLVITFGLSLIFALILATLAARVVSGAQSTDVVAFLAVVLWAAILVWSLGRELRA